MIEEATDLIYMVVECMVCQETFIGRRKHGRQCLAATKIHKMIWRDPILREILIELTDTPYHKLKDSGPFIIRNYIYKMLRRYNGPAVMYLKEIACGNNPDPTHYCMKIIEVLEQVLTEQDPAGS